MEEHIFETIGFLGALIVALAGVPQIVKTHKLKNSSGLSIFFFLIIEIGISLLTIYSFHTKNMVYIFANGLSLLLNTVLILLWWRYRK